MAEKLVYNASEVATLLGVSKPIVYELFHRRDFPTIKLSERRTVVTADALKKWLDRQAQEAADGER